MKYNTYTAVAAAFVFLLLGTGCDTSSDDRSLTPSTAAPVSEKLSFATSQAFADAVSEAEDRSSEEQAAWETERGFTSLRSSREAEAPAGLAARKGDPDDGTTASADLNQDPAVAALLNADGEVLIDGYTLRVRDGVSRLLSPDGTQVAEAVTYTELPPDGAALPSQPVLRTFVQVYHGGVSPIADNPPRPDQTRFLMNAKIYRYDYLVYATYGAYTGSEEFKRGRFGGRGWSESDADLIAINCTLSDGQTRIDQNSTSKVDVDFDRAIITPGVIVLNGTTAGGYIALSGVRAACNHSVRMPSRDGRPPSPATALTGE